MRVAILNISIGEYCCFWEEFYNTAEKNFLTDCQKEYFVFTDAVFLYKETDEKVHKVYCEDMGWPYNTMKRFHLFMSIEKELMVFDYAIFINANAVFRQCLTSKIFLKNKDIITVEHPGMHFKEKRKLPFESRKESCAFVPLEQRKIYVQGALLGGRLPRFVEFVKELDQWIEEDLKKGIIAVWHDESFLNKYVVENNNVQVLGWQYLKYEEYIMPYQSVIELRKKENYITKVNGRFKGRRKWYSEFYLYVRNIKWKIRIKLGKYKWCNIIDKKGNYIALDIREDRIC